MPTSPERWRHTTGHDKPCLASSTTTSPTRQELNNSSGLNGGGATMTGGNGAATSLNKSLTHQPTLPASEEQKKRPKSSGTMLRDPATTMGTAGITRPQASTTSRRMRIGNCTRMNFFRSFSKDGTFSLMLDLKQLNATWCKQPSRRISQSTECPKSFDVSGLMMNCDAGIRLPSTLVSGRTICRTWRTVTPMRMRASWWMDSTKKVRSSIRWGGSWDSRSPGCDPTGQAHFAWGSISPTPGETLKTVLQD